MGQRRLFPKTRSAVTSDGHTVAGTTQNPHESYSFNMSRMKLRETHKRLRAGLVYWEDVPEETRRLLQEYYGYTKEGIQL
jgi:hypothetical protein